MSCRLSPSQAMAAPQELHEVQLADEPRDIETPSKHGARSRCFASVFQEALFYVFAIFASASFLVLQRVTVILTKFIMLDLRMNAAEGAWTTAGPGLAAGAVLLPLVFLLDSCEVLSQKTYLLASLAAFSLLTGLISVSPNGICFEILSTMSGIACAAHMSGIAAIFGSAYPTGLQREGLAYTFFLVGGNSVAFVVGNAGPGMVATFFSWRAAYVFVSIVYAVVTALGCLAVPGSSKTADSASGNTGEAASTVASFLQARKTSISEFDWTGTILVYVGITMTAAAWTMGPLAAQQWKTPYILLLLILGGLSLIAFGFWEFFSKNPLIPSQLWSNRNSALLIVSVLCSAMGYFTVLFWVPLFLQDAQNLTPMQVSNQMIPPVIFGCIITVFGRRLLRRIHNTALLAFAGSCQMGSAVLLIFLRSRSNYFALVFPSLILSATSIDLVLIISSQHIVPLMPLKKQGVAEAVLQTVTRLAVTVGVSITTVVWSSVDLASKGADPELAFTTTFKAMTAFAGLSLLLAPFTDLGKLGDDYCDNSSRECNRCHRQSLPDATVDYSDEKPRLVVTNGCSPGNGDEGAWGGTQTRSSSSSLRTHRFRPLATPSAGNVLDRSAADHKHACSPLTANVHGRDKQDGRAATTSSRNNSMVERVIWLVCEDCGSSKRMAEPVGDPKRYFYDSDAPVITDKQSETGDSSVPSVRCVPLGRA